MTTEKTARVSAASQSTPPAETCGGPSDLIAGVGRIGWRNKNANITPDQTNISAAKGFFAAQNCGELDDAFATYVHPDFRFVVSCTCNDELRAAIPWAGYEHRGREGYRRLTALLFSEYELLACETTRFTDAGNQVFVEGHFRLRHRQTARIADSDFLVRFEMRDAKIVRGQVYENTAAVAAARHTE